MWVAVEIVRKDVLVSVAGIPLVVVSVSVAAVMDATEVALERAVGADKVVLVFN